MFACNCTPTVTGVPAPTATRYLKSEIPVPRVIADPTKTLTCGFLLWRVLTFLGGNSPPYCVQNPSALKTSSTRRTSCSQRNFPDDIVETYTAEFFQFVEEKEIGPLVPPIDRKMRLKPIQGRNER